LVTVCPPVKTCGYAAGYCATCLLAADSRCANGTNEIAVAGPSMWPVPLQLCLFLIRQEFFGISNKCTSIYCWFTSDHHQLKAAPRKEQQQTVQV